MTSLLARIFAGVHSYFSSFYMNILIAIIVALVGFIFGKIAGRLIARILHEMELNALLRATTRITIDIEQFLARGVQWLVSALGILAALRTLRIAPVLLTLLLGLLVLVIVLGMLLALRDFLPNILATLYVIRHKRFRVGDVIRTQQIEGTIVTRGLIDTVVRTPDGHTAYIPNRVLVKKGVIVKQDKKGKNRK